MVKISLKKALVPLQEFNMLTNISYVSLRMNLKLVTVLSMTTENMELSYFKRLVINNDKSSCRNECYFMHMFYSRTRFWVRTIDLYLNKKLIIWQHIRLLPIYSIMHRMALNMWQSLLILFITNFDNRLIIHSWS